MKIELQPWQTPNFVIVKVPPRPRQEGWQEAPKFPLSEVDAETLAQMCEAFRVEVFRKAGKVDPATLAKILRDAGEAPRAGEEEPS